MGAVLALAIVGAAAIAMLPKQGADLDATPQKPIPQTSRA
jgi:hypothetical protein